jgi:hypothetical protein
VCDLQSWMASQSGKGPSDRYHAQEEVTYLRESFISQVHLQTEPNRRYFLIKLETKRRKKHVFVQNKYDIFRLGPDTVSSEDGLGAFQNNWQIMALRSGENAHSSE